MSTFAVTMRSRPQQVDGILMLLDERQDAEQIAWELRRRGQSVEVHELTRADARWEDVAMSAAPTDR